MLAVACSPKRKGRLIYAQAVFDPDATAQHETPAWRERADFIIGVPLEEHAKWEQLWVRRLAATRFEICCIPFLAYGIALGDVVETEPQDGREFMVARVVERSGHRTMRVWFVDTTAAQQVADNLLAAGALLEWRGAWSRLLALDAKGDDMTHSIFEVLRPYESSGKVEVETGGPSGSGPVAVT
jgi:Domain of unknown function (DUF4265)